MDRLRRPSSNMKTLMKGRTSLRMQPLYPSPQHSEPVPGPSSSTRTASTHKRVSTVVGDKPHGRGAAVPNTFGEEKAAAKEEPISLDLSVYDEYGNRTVPIYRRSVKLKFDTKDRIAEFMQHKRMPMSPLPFNYHSETVFSESSSKSVSGAWKSRLLDDDVITAAINHLQLTFPESLFVNPCLTQCILFAKVKHVALFLDPLGGKKYANVFFVLNDSRRPGGCSHWSLLVYNRASGRLYHFDSMHNTNYKVAYELAQKLCEYMNVWAMTDVYCEQQTNMTDCGYYVIDNMLKLLYVMKNAPHTPLSQVDRLPSLIEKTKNFVINLYTKSGAGKN